MSGRVRTSRAPVSPLAAVALVFVVAVLLVVGACGVPTDGATRRIDPADVPYSLAAPGTPAPPPPVTGAPAADGGRVWFLDADAALTAVAADEVGGAGGVQDVLDRLAAGPSAQEREAGLRSALGPDVQLRLASTQARTASVEVQALSQDLGADRLPLAVGQIVLSVTSVPGVDGVRLQREGTDREVPLPGGALTSRVLTAQDYAPLVGVAG